MNKDVLKTKKFWVLIVSSILGVLVACGYITTDQMNDYVNMAGQVIGLIITGVSGGALYKHIKIVKTANGIEISTDENETTDQK